jgi:hypothetical protein
MGVALGIALTELTGVILSILLLLKLKNDSEDETLSEEERLRAKIKLDEYDNKPFYEKDLSTSIPLKDGWLQIPKQYDIGLLASVVERVLYGAIVSPDTSPAGDSLTVGQRIGEQFPFDKPFRGLGYISPVGEEPLSVGYKGFKRLTNPYDRFRERYIIPPTEQKLTISRRITEGASAVGQTVQKASDILTPEDKNYMIDARTVDAFIEGQFTYYGKWAMQLAEYIDKEKDKVRPMYRFKPLDFMGVHKYAPAFNSPDVKWLYDAMALHDMRSWLPEVPKLMNTLTEYYMMQQSENDKAEVEKAAFYIRMMAGIVRDIGKDLDLYDISDKQAFIKKVRMRVITPEDFEKYGY